MAFLSRSILAMSIALSSLNVSAKAVCEVELRHGLIITDDVIRIVDKGQTRVQINNDNQLFIRGYWIDLTSDETLVLKQFSAGIRDTVPELVELAMISFLLPHNHYPKLMIFLPKRSVKKFTLQFMALSALF